MTLRLPSWTAKLAVRFVLVIGLLHVCFLGGAFFGLDTFLERLFRDTAKAEAADIGRVITSSLQQEMLRRQGPTVDATLADLLASRSIRSVAIVDTKGRVAHATDRRMVGRVLDKDRDATCVVCHRASSESHDQTWFAVDAMHEPVIRHVEAVPNAPACHQCHDARARLNGIVVVERSMGVFQSALWTIRYRLAGTAALTMLALFAATLLFNRRQIVRPIERLVDGARHFGRGNLDYRIAVRGHGEVADLAGAFNAMAADLGRTITEVRTKTAELTIVYSILERVTRSIHLTELQVVILQTFLDVFQTDVVLLAGRSHEDDALELRWLRRGLARVQTLSVEGADRALPPEVRADLISSWERDGLSAPVVTPDSRAIALPIVGSRTRALLVLERRRPFVPAEANLALLKMIAQHAAVAYDNACLYTLAVTDPLTRLFTVRLFHEQLDEQVATWQRERRGFALVMIDLDHFKTVNDTYGHPAGDQVLKAVSDTIREVIRLTDTAYRYGGEEFCALLPGAGAEGAAATAERIRAGLERTEVTVPAGATLRLTASLGVAVCPAGGTTARDVLAAADEALYRAKRDGRNRVCVAGQA